MGVKITKGTYGYVSCIISDQFFNYCNALSGGKTIFQNGAFTADGITFMSNLGLDAKQVYGTLLMSNVQTSINYSTGLWMLHSIFPQIEVVPAGTVPLSPADYDVKLYAESSYFRIRQLVNTVQPANGYIVTWYNKGPNLSDGAFGDNNQSSPYGHITPQSLEYSIAVFNANKSDCLILRTSTNFVASTKTVSILKIKSSTATPLEEMVLWYNLPDLNGVDPYTPGGTSEPTPPIPPGDFDNTSDPIDLDPLPTLSAVNTKFITLFSPDLSELQSLASYMWGTSFDLNQFKKLFTDPMGAILGLSIIPFTPDHASIPTPVTLGNIQTSVSMCEITSQYKQVPCGTLNVHEYWGAYLDYSPYTKLEIYLPYIGIQTLDADDVMGKSITIAYNIDVLTGACVALLKCGDSVLYTFSGSCATSIPITGRDWTNVVNGIIGIGSSLASFGINVAGGNAGGAISSAASAVQNVFETKPGIQKSGSMGSMPGMLGHQKPYLILTRPRQALPEEQNTFTGYPSYVTETLGNLTGYTIVDRIHLSGFYALDDELSEIETLLKSGVIL